MAKTPKKTNPNIKRCVDLFFEKFSQKFGFPPKINGGKDGAHFKEILATWDVDVVVALVDEFFSTTDPRIVRSDYTIGAFYSLAQYLRLRGNRTDDRTLANLDAASRASKPRT